MAGSTTTWDAKQFEEKTSAAPLKVRQKVSSEFNRVGTLTASELRAKMRRDTSYMAEHVEVVHSTPATLIEEIRAGANYTLAQDEGTRAFFPPVSALVESGWAKRHNKTKYSDKAFAFLVARAISQRGIKPMNVIKPVTASAKAQLVVACKEAVSGIW